MDPTTVPRAAIEAATAAGVAVISQCPFWHPVEGCCCGDHAHDDDPMVAAALAAAAPLLVAAERARLVALAGSNGLAANRLRGLTADLVGATAERDLDQVQKIWPIWFEALDTLLAAHGAAVERARGEALEEACRAVCEFCGDPMWSLVWDRTALPPLWVHRTYLSATSCRANAVRALAARRPDA